LQGVLEQSLAVYAFSSGRITVIATDRVKHANVGRIPGATVEDAGRTLKVTRRVRQGFKRDLSGIQATLTARRSTGRYEYRAGLTVIPSIQLLPILEALLRNHLADSDATQSAP
jgi:hypothetical protein